MDMDGEVETPAVEHLFTVQDNTPKVTKEVGELYHSLTAHGCCSYQSEHGRRFRQQWHSYVQGHRPPTTMITRNWQEWSDICGNIQSSR
jgi:hypothetical protein